MKTIFCKIFFVALLIFAGQDELLADDPGGIDPTSGKRPSAPIDGGTLALIAGGAILGIRRWQQRKIEENAKS